MSDGARKQYIPRLIEPRKFAHQGIDIAGELPADALTRLAEIAISQNIVADLQFSLGEQRERLLKGSIQADVQQQCQRCLKPVDSVLECEISLAVVRDEEEAKNLPESYDPWVVSEEEADLYAIIEEEILLAVPLIANHSEPCGDELDWRSQEPSQDQQNVNETNPFQVLEQLKGKTKKAPKS